MNLLEFLILATATYRTAYLLTNEDGPFLLALKFRQATTLGGLLTCLKCASVWCALFMWLLWQTPLQPVVIVFAVSGAALMLTSYSGVNHL